jgi:DNA-binding transcriptional ArsR family regulator
MDILTQIQQNLDALQKQIDSMQPVESVIGKDRVEDIDENKVAKAVEAFSSPKRINIIKALLAKEFLSSNELTMKTGCIGGQLYHHLSILEAANIICKSNESYTLTESGRVKTDQILAVAYGESV